MSPETVQKFSVRLNFLGILERSLEMFFCRFKN